MDTMMAAARAEIARANNDPMRVFDWNKAAQILKERNPEVAEAGLSDDLEWTSGIIWYNHEPIMDDYTFLASCWAVPVLIIDDVEIECWVYMDDVIWNADTKWPDSAIEVINK